MLPKSARRLFKFFTLFVGFKAIFLIGWIFFAQNRHHEKILENFRLYMSLQHIGVKSYPQPTNFEKKDWHDLNFINYEKERKGIGEQGRSHELTDQADIELDRQLMEIEGIHVLISDKISVNRSIKDTRPQM